MTFEKIKALGLKHPKICFILAGTVLLLGASFGFSLLASSQGNSAESTEQAHSELASGEPAKPTEMAENLTEKSAAETWLADIKGAVKKPGVYEVTANERIIDLVTKAGGFAEAADDTKVNLAQHVSDQLVVYIPEVGEVIPEHLAQTTTSTLTSPATGEMNATVDEQTATININTANQSELQTLPGIGEKKAQEIINYREEHGPFQAITNITEVAGIGVKTLENISNMITIK